MARVALLEAVDPIPCKMRVWHVLYPINPTPVLNQAAVAPSRQLANVARQLTALNTNMTADITNNDPQNTQMTSGKHRFSERRCHGRLTGRDSNSWIIMSGVSSCVQNGLKETSEKHQTPVSRG